MDLHPSREMVASGQRAGRSRKTQAHIRIWSTETLLTLYVFGMGELDAGVSAVAFSQLVRVVPSGPVVRSPFCSVLSTTNQEWNKKLSLPNIWCGQRSSSS